MLCNNYLVSRVIFIVIEGVAYRDLYHLAILKEVLWPYLDRPVLLMFHHSCFLLSIWILDVFLLVFLTGLPLTLPLFHPSPYVFFLFRAHLFVLILSIHPIKIMHLPYVGLANTFLNGFNILSLPLRILLHLLLLSLLKHQGYRDGILESALEAELGIRFSLLLYYWFGRSLGVKAGWGRTCAGLILAFGLS